MIQSVMLVIDILFPFNLRPLTYICPAVLEGKAVPGTLVYAPLKGKTKMGIIYGITPDFKGKPDTLRGITGIAAHRSALSQEIMRLIVWIAEYYLAEPGIVLSFVLPRVFFTDEKKTATRRAADLPKQSFKPQKIKKEDLIMLKTGANPDDILKPVLLHTPSYDYQLSYICKAAKSSKKALILCPTIEEVRYLGAVVFDTTGIRPILIHGGLSPAQRLSASEEAINADKYSIVIGTMSAALFPFIKASLIIVADEHSPYYKHERTPRYNARDVAVMRGKLQNSRVVLMSSCPSSDSYFKTTTNEYTYYTPPAAAPKRPQISILATRSFKKLIPDRITTAITTAAEKGGKSFVYVNKKGYSTIICKDCGTVEKCPVCKVTLAFHEDKSMRCHRCGYTTKPRDFCPVCSGLDLREVSPGSERLVEFIREKTGLTPVRIDRDTAKTPAIFKRMAGSALRSAVLIGTKLSLNKIVFNKHFKIIAAVNPDVYFSFPGYLTAERLYQDVLVMSEMAEKDGRIYLLTALKEELTYKFLENYDYEGFISNELEKRKELNYPPFWKMASIEFHYNDEKPDIKLEGSPGVVEVLGPVPSEDIISGYSQSARMIIKAKDSAYLAGAINSLKDLIKQKNHSKLRLVIDIDPV